MANVKKESGESRVQRLEGEVQALQGDVKKFLSIITIQTEQLARQEKLLAKFEDERSARSGGRATARLDVVLLVVVFLLLWAVWAGVPALFNENTVLNLNVKATPLLKMPVPTIPVRTSFTVGDFIATVKGACRGKTVRLSVK